MMLGIVLQEEVGYVFGSGGSMDVPCGSMDSGGNGTADQDHLGDHQFDHRSQCHVCLKVFQGNKRKYRLDRHMVTHTGERRFQCSFCPYKANQKEHLVRHLRTKH
ncbi:Zinc finger C2H2-type, partial [Trinorchestia longiramus]